jgi:hypothetical protein
VPRPGLGEGAAARRLNEHKSGGMPGRRRGAMLSHGVPFEQMWEPGQAGAAAAANARTHVPCECAGQPRPPGRHACVCVCACACGCRTCCGTAVRWLGAARRGRLLPAGRPGGPKGGGAAQIMIRSSSTPLCGAPRGRHATHPYRHVCYSTFKGYTKC